MVTSQLNYMAEFAHCEREELRITGHIQAGFDTVVLNGPTLVAATRTCLDWTDANAAALAAAPVIEATGPRHHLVNAGPHGQWLRHTSGPHTIFERALGSAENQNLSLPSSDQLLDASRGNLWKLGFRVCSAISDALQCERAMIYRFHDDWSGEVIAEKTIGSVEPFLGLRYPPTDIPKQARQLFLEVGTRHIFTTTRGNLPVVALSEESDQTIDLTHALGRSVSPYHIEYLRNMGSASTASCGLIYEGRLWGLLSIHFAQERPPSIAEFALLQNFLPQFNTLLSDTLKAQAQDVDRRATSLISEFNKTLEDDNDVFHTMFLSRSALANMVGASGACLLLKDQVCAIGTVPDPSLCQKLCAEVGGDASLGDPIFLDRLPDRLACENFGASAGAVVIKLDPEGSAFLCLFRSALSQSVSWGGDPRRSAQTEDKLRYSPRKSFERWIEQVEGQAVPWDGVAKTILRASLAAIFNAVETKDCDLPTSLRAGLGKVVADPRQLRALTLEALDKMPSAIALALEMNATQGDKILSLNRTAMDAFAATSLDLDSVSLAEAEHILRTSLLDQVPTNAVRSVVTATNGIRECEISRQCIFDYHSADPATAFRFETVMFNDITEARRIEQTLQYARDRAMRDMELRAEFYAKLSHELRTPLNAVIGLSSLLMRNVNKMPDPKTQRHIELIASASRHLKDLVDNTLENSQAIEITPAECNTETSLSQTVNEAVSMLEQSAFAAKVALTKDALPDVTIAAEPRGIRQVLLNIIGNAVKYNVPGGTVQVSAALQDNDMVRLTIADTGTGMSEDNLRRCMQPYQRFATGEGSGLGLSISYHLIAIMGGVITMESELGEGTIVHIFLPLRRHAPQTAPQTDDDIAVQVTV